jgi:phosphatidylserine synthase 2
VAAGCFVFIGALLIRDGPFIRPHPLFWRLIQALSVLYLLLMIFLLFQPLQLARQIVGFTDESLGRPLEEKSYADDCSLTWDNVKVRYKDE